jgi:hypothetical protein
MSLTLDPDSFSWIRTWIAYIAYLTLSHSNEGLGSDTIDLILNLGVLALPVGYGLVDLPLQLLALANCSKLRLTVCASCTQGSEFYIFYFLFVSHGMSIE